MLHTMFQGNLPTGSEKDDIRAVYTTYGQDGHFGRVTVTFKQQRLH